METSIINWIISSLPIILLIVLLAIFRWSVIKAAGLTLIITLLTTYFYFKGSPLLIFTEALKGGWNALTIIAVVFPAILIYEIVHKGNCINAINQVLEELSPNELFKIMAIGWIFAGFLQGITGFGVPVAICVPLLVAMGVKAKWAVIISLLGQAWGNTFGTLAIAREVIVEISGITGGELLSTAIWATLFLWSLNLLSGLAICWFYGKWKGIYKGLPIILIISLVQGGGQMLLSQYNQSIAAFIPSTVALIAIVIISKLPVYRTKWEIENSKIMDKDMKSKKTTGKEKRSKTIIAFSPYLILVAVTILLLVIKPINQFLGQWSFGFAFPATTTGYVIVNPSVDKYSPIKPFVDSSAVLFITCIFSYILLRKNKLLEKNSYKELLDKTLEKVLPSTVSIIELLIISKWMSGSGQTLLIAEGITTAFGIYYTLMASTLGLIGSFITGSNMSSNILFVDVQMNASGALGIGHSTLLGAQTTGGAIGSIISPSKIILGTTSAGINGKEGEVLRELLPFAIISTIIVGILCWIII